MSVATLSSKGWIVIPASVRKKYGLNPGDQIQIVDYGGLLVIVPAKKNPIQEAIGMLHGENSLTDALLEEHAREREHEDR